MESLTKLNDKKRIQNYRLKIKIKQNLSNAITLLRLLTLPHLIYSFNNLNMLISFSIFLASVTSDLLDGYVARKLKTASKLGAYLDILVDFLFIIGMYLNFSLKGIYTPWILLIIVLVFTQFIISNIIVKHTIYDPIGKYFGSILYGGIGITILISEHQIYSLITTVIVFTALLSIISRFYYLVKRKNLK